MGSISNYQREVYRVGVESYSESGHLPFAYGSIVHGDPVSRPIVAEWRMIEHRFDIDPARFDHYHPMLVGLFTPPECIGKLPETPFFDMLRHRYELAPHRFTHYHPVLGRLIKRDLETICPPMIMAPEVPMVTPPEMPPEMSSGGGVPEPGTFWMLVIGLVFVLALRSVSARRTRWATSTGVRNGR
jgi:hypothetical protein